jgi:hypothetical protein
MALFRSDYQATQRRAKTTKSVAKNRRTFQTDQAAISAQPNAFIRRSLSTPERFVRKRPKPPQIPTAVWINPPKQTEPAQA